MYVLSHLVDLITVAIHTEVGKRLWSGIYNLQSDVLAALTRGQELMFNSKLVKWMLNFLYSDVMTWSWNSHNKHTLKNIKQAAHFISSEGYEKSRKKSYLE